jgi:hypothetical protein
MDAEGGNLYRTDNSKSKFSAGVSTARFSVLASVWGEQSQVLENEEYLLGEMNLFSQSKKVFDLIYKQNPSYIVEIN